MATSPLLHHPAYCNSDLQLDMDICHRYDVIWLIKDSIQMSRNVFLEMVLLPFPLMAD